MHWIEGYIAGISMVVFIGPVFFTLLKSTLQYNRGAGFAVASGIIVSDIVCVLICSLTTVNFFTSPSSRFWLAVGGSLLLAMMGIRYLWSPAKYSEKNLHIKAGHYIGFFTKGFMVNFLNPFVFLVWIGVIGYMNGKYIQRSEHIIFLGATLAGILTTDLLKVVLAHKIKKFVTPRALLIISRSCGVILLGFTIRLAFYAFYTG